MTDLTIPVSMDGPYSPEQTQQAARAVAEGIRYLNHCSHPGNDGGLEYPGDVYDLLGHLYTATGRLPQLLEQVAAFLQGQAEGGRTGDSNGRDPVNQSLIAGMHLEDAASSAGSLTERLQAAQNAISGLYAKDGSDV